MRCSTISAAPADLAAGRIRFVGDPATRIAEDYLRILRFFRFYARFGRVPPDPDTLAALQAGIPGLARLSVERVWTRTAADPGRAGPVGGGRADGAAGDLGGGGAGGAVGRLRLAGLPADPVLRLAAMLTGDPLALAARLKMSNEDRDRLVRLVATPSPAGSDADLRRLLADHAPADLIDRTWLDGDAGRAAAAVRHAAAGLPAGRPRCGGAGRSRRPGCRRAAARRCGNGGWMAVASPIGPHA